jgi:hypothetical protein
MSESDAFFYNDARRALDATPGSREFFRSLKPDDVSREFFRSLKPHDVSRGPLVDAVQDKMSSSHSGASMTCLIACYRAALKDWDAWVLAVKRDKIMREYKEKQIDFISLNTFYCHLVYVGVPVNDEEGFKAAMEKAHVSFSDGEKPVEVTWDNGAPLLMVTTLLHELTAMRKEEEAKWNARQLKEQLEYLEWNLKHPSRWFWSRDRHPRYSIRPDEMAEMERLHPGYHKHMDLVCDHINRIGIRAGMQWSPENADVVTKQLIELGIATV